MTLFSRARWGLALWFAAFLAVILVVIGGIVYGSARRSLMTGVNSDLSDRAAPIVDRVGRGGIRQIETTPAFTAGGYFYAVANDQGTLLGTSQNVDQEGLPPADDVTQAAVQGARYVDTRSSDGARLRVLVTPLPSNVRGGLVLEVGRSTEPEYQALRRMIFLLLVGGGVGLVLAVGAGFVLATRALKPIKQSMDRQRTFVADASHELRTPLALIRANAEILKRGATKPVIANMTSVDDIISETDRLSNLVGQMLKLTRADSGDNVAGAAPVDLTALAGDAVRRMRLLAEPKQMTIGLEAAGPAVVLGDEVLLGELLTILLDNAIKYSDEGASVMVGLRRTPEQVLLSVADAGHGIPAAALPRIFDRFYRVDKARSREMGGAGLGLAIAKWIVEAHGGRIGIESRVGQGTTVTVELPASSAPAPLATPAPAEKEPPVEHEAPAEAAAAPVEDAGTR